MPKSDYDYGSGYPYVHGDYIKDNGKDCALTEQETDELHVRLYELGSFRDNRERDLVYTAGWYFGCYLILDERRTYAELMRDEIDMRHRKMDCHECGCPYERAPAGPYIGCMESPCHDDIGCCRAVRIYKITENGTKWVHR